MTTAHKTDAELMESAHMLMAQTSEMLAELDRRGIKHNAIFYTDSWNCTFYKVQDVTPKGRVK